MKYRSEIDGLRAVAVLPVVLFHSGISLFSGGYLGVDVFFVISGYLISTIILEDIEKKRFSILTFYERRFRRILPAYIVMILVTSIFAWLWMMPDELRNYGQSVFASSAFSSNILFLTEAGYFITGSAEKPLLHTWSLSVEEQFYLFFPLLLFALSRYGTRRMAYAIALLSIASAGLSEFGWRVYPSANFYLLPFRAWELGIGALSAMYLRSSGQQKSSLLSGIGFVVLICCIVLFTESTPVPSLYALAPVIATALIIIYASAGTWVASLLSHKYFVFIGLISYSAYLWHQPLLAFVRIRTIPVASDVGIITAALASFLIGYFSWKFIENPFRAGGYFSSWSRAQVLKISLSSLAALGSLGLLAHFTDGFPGRVPEQSLKLASFIDDKSPLENEDNCAFYDARPVPKHPVKGCSDYLKNGRADVVFIGDSHSGAISYDAQIALNEIGLSSYSITYSGCIGLRGFRHLGMPVGYDCSGYNEGMIDFAKRSGAKVLVITSRFPLYLYGTRFDNGEGGLEHGREVHYERIIDDSSSYKMHNAETNRKNIMLSGMIEEIETLTEEFSVVLLDPIPEAGWSPPQLAARTAFFDKNDTFVISTDYDNYQNRVVEIVNAFDSIKSENLYRVHPQDALCNKTVPGRCLNATQDEVLYFDNNHVTRTGARLIVPDIVSAVTTALSK